MATPSQTKTIAKTGAAIWEGADKEADRQKAKAAARADGLDRIFRTLVPPGEEKEVVILDDAPGIALYEHNLKDSEGRYRIYEECTKEEFICPVCEKVGTDSSYVVYLSVLELDAYKDKTTGEWRNSRSLLGIKTGQLPTFKKIFAAAAKKHGSLRGVVLNLQRPEGAVQNSPRIGEPVEFEETGTRFDFIANLEAECGNKEIKAKDGTVLKKANADIQPFDYQKVFPGAFNVEKLQADLKARYGGEPVPGSKEESEKEWDNEDEATGQQTRTRRGSSRSRVEAEQEEPRRARRTRGDSPETKEEEERPPRRTRGSSKSEDVDDADDADDAGSWD
jgi:hypothetical protein